MPFFLRANNMWAGRGQKSMECNTIWKKNARLRLLVLWKQGFGAGRPAGTFNSDNSN